jgi:hypothetical protein
MPSCNLVGDYKPFGGIFCLRLQDRKFLWNVSNYLPDYTVEYSGNYNQSFTAMESWSSTCLGGNQFESLPSCQLSWLKFLWFSSVSSDKYQDSVVACPLKAGIIESEDTTVTRLWHCKQWHNNAIRHATQSNQWSYRWERSLWVRAEAISVESKHSWLRRRVMSLQLAIRRQTCWRSSQAVAPSWGASIVVSRCVATPSRPVR